MTLTLGDHDSDSGFEQSCISPNNDYHSLYVEPWTNYHKEPISLQPEHSTANQISEFCHREGDKVKIFVSGPNPEKKTRKITNSYNSTGPNDERFYGKSFFF